MCTCRTLRQAAEAPRVWETVAVELGSQHLAQQFLQWLEQRLEVGWHARASLPSRPLSAGLLLAG